MRLRMLGLVVVFGALALGACNQTSKGGGGAVALPPTAGLQARAAAITDLAVKNDWVGVRKDFDTTMLAGLSEQKLADAWAQVTVQFGTFTKRNEPVKVEKPGPYTVFDTPMTFSRGAAKSRVTFDADGKVGGLFFLVPSAP